ncbi:MAG: nicotinate-nucleotide adenylyltransferase [Burkholderiales bacterium]|nr:nicotinate-nucleotide adenylyltransferase [Burkholderiales bacterium]
MTGTPNPAVPRHGCTQTSCPRVTGSDHPAGSLRARRVGLMGGSFDPVHQAHIALATLALTQLQLDEVRWIPVGEPWQKARPLTAAVHRVEMVRLATAHVPRFVVDTLEVNRPGPSYTLDTVRTLQAMNLPGINQDLDQWFLIIGQDQYRNLPTWNGWQELIQRVTLAVAGREGVKPVAAPELAAQPHRMVELRLPPMSISSTEIRARLARGDDPQTLAPAMVSNAVARYIAQHQLYAAGTPR